MGVALYRRFPTCTDLAIEVFGAQHGGLFRCGRQRLDKSVGRRRVPDLIFDLCALQAADPGRRALLTTAFPASSLIEQRVAETVEKVGELVERAHRDGALRPDVGWVTWW